MKPLSLIGLSALLGLLAACASPQIAAIASLRNALKSPADTDGACALHRNVPPLTLIGSKTRRLRVLVANGCAAKRLVRPLDCITLAAENFGLRLSAVLTRAHPK
jgi:hypothetical protein